MRIIIIIFEYVITKSIRIEDKKKIQEGRRERRKEDLKISFFFGVIQN